MRSIIFSFALLTASATINCTDKSKAQGKKITSQLTEYQVFAQKYEAAFGEKPSDQVWNLGKADCDTHSCVACSSCGY
jgi:hypothetical protein